MAEQTDATFFNRELSFLEFNQRVVDEAADKAVPLLERLKFVSIASANLDEFFMVRVAGLKQQHKGAVMDSGPDGMLPSEQLQKILPRVAKQIDAQENLLFGELIPELCECGIEIAQAKNLTDKQWLAEYFESNVFPLLTPLAVDPGHPFPFLKNRTLNLAVYLVPQSSASELSPLLAIVQVPPFLPRFVQVPKKNKDLCVILIEDLIVNHVHRLFTGMRILKCVPFRVLRNWDLEVNEDEQEDLLHAVENQLRSLWKLDAVQLAVGPGASEDLIEALRVALDLHPDDVLHHRGPLALGDFSQLLALAEKPNLRDRPFQPVIPPQFSESESIFSSIARSDILLHHPYESYAPVVRMVLEASSDPNVLAIKQTLYRTNRNSPIVRALVEAAKNGKQVTVLVELKARFDEQINVEWARELEEAGVQVFYGMIGLKTHCKVTLVVRRESGGIKRYSHLGTGNYNEKTALIYSDLSFFTAREEVGADMSALFNLLTGYSEPPKWNRLVVAPLDLRRKLVKRIAKAKRKAEGGSQAEIIFKSNALIDPQVIQALYDASLAGVKITLLIRGPCGLRIKVPGLSEGIEVRMIVDRFLEHSRIFYFRLDEQETVYITSTDIMPRNFDRRVEVMLPIDDDSIKRRVIDEILATELSDTAKASVLNRKGKYVRVKPSDPAIRAQEIFLKIAAKRAVGFAAGG
jgi:polyphosphate kinase